MSEPRRYLDGDRAALSARLLASAEHDAPDARSMQRALAVAAALGATGTATATATASVSAVAWLKWLAIGAVAGGVSVAAYDRVAPARAPSPHAASATGPVAAAPGPTSSAPSPVEVVAPPPVEVVAPPPALSAEPAPRPALPVAPAESAEPEAPKDTLRAELLQIDAARKRQAAGDARGAIDQLDRYQREFPRGRFAAEAALIRAEALVSQGNCGAVRRMASEAGDGGVLSRRWSALRARCP